MSIAPVESFIEHRWEPRHFWLRKPRPVGSRFLIVRVDRTPPGTRTHPGRLPIFLDIRRSFGSGGHGTTEGCIRALERTIRGGETVLDLGTGSGILAIAAVKLGASRVTAVDIRESACREASGNLVLNNVQDEVQVLRGGIDSAAGRFGLVVANLRTPILAGLIGEILQCAEDSGTLILSGIMLREVPSFCSLLERFPVSPADRILVGGWATLVARGESRGN